MIRRQFSDQEIIRRKKLETLCNNYYKIYDRSQVEFDQSIQTILEQNQKYDKPTLEALKIHTSTVGRIIAIRQTFLVIKKDNFRLQIYLHKKSHPELFEKLNLVDLGDVLFVKGVLFRTNLGELTLKVHDFQIIAKALHPLPDKHSGLKDRELKLRKRYVDAIVNDEVFDVFKLRALIIQTIRTHLISQKYLEVETPYLQSILGGAAARPFVTHYNSLNQNFYLRIAPELALKQMVVAGFDRIFEIGKSFRNEGIDSTHSPEFTSLEMYTAFEGLEQTIARTQGIFDAIVQATGIQKIN